MSAAAATQSVGHVTFMMSIWCFVTPSALCLCLSLSICLIDEASIIKFAVRSLCGIVLLWTELAVHMKFLIHIHIHRFYVAIHGCIHIYRWPFYQVRQNKVAP